MGRHPKFKNQLTLKQYPKIEKSTRKISDKNCLELRTGKNHIIRILLECIKYIIYETNIVFYPDSKKGSSSSSNIAIDKEQDLITISNQDDDGNVAIYIELNGNEFEHYFCDKKNVIGINILELFNVIKSVDKDDIIFIYMEKNNIDQLFISTENSKSKEITKTAIHTKDYENEGIEIPALEFDMSIDIPSTKFQKICKDFYSFKVKDIKLEVIDKQIIISAGEGYVERHVMFQGEINQNENIEQSSEEDLVLLNDYEDNYIYKGTFVLSYFINFIKATPLCNKVTFFLNNNGPLMVKYKIINIGEICFILNSIDS